MFTGKGLVFRGPYCCDLENVEFSAAALEPGQLLVDTECSIVSAGTEVANFTGSDPGTKVAGSWNVYPWRPGYGAVGRVVAVGPELGAVPAHYEVGDRVFSISNHAKFAIASPNHRPVVKISEDDNAQIIVLGRMASVSITALRKVLGTSVGGCVAVTGLGLVGNFAAQLFQLAGMHVLGLDRSRYRVEMAERSGLAAIVSDASTQRASVLRTLGSDAGADVVVEASGAPDAVTFAVSLAADGAEVVLLGSPRGRFGGDATAMLSEVHHRGIRVVGALEWLLPLRSGPWQSRWSLYDDYSLLFDMLRRGRLSTDGIVRHVVAPENAQETYIKLANEGPSMGAVVFDWTA